MSEWQHQIIHTFGDKGHHLLPWLTMLHKQIGASYYVLEALFNKYMNCARVVVRNNFGILIFGNGLSCQTWMWISFLMWSWLKVRKRVKIVWRFIWTQQNCEHMKLWKTKKFKYFFHSLLCLSFFGNCITKNNINILLKK